jgi:hypothetical protein
MKHWYEKKILTYIGLLLSALFISTSLLAKEELAIVQTVSNDRRSFVISKGIKDGILRGQEYIFSSENVSIVCKALEVSRDFSLWVPKAKTVTLPFNKEDVISLNSSVYGNVGLEIAADTNLIPEEDMNEIYREFRKSNNISVKVAYNRGLSQSSSSVSTEKNPARSGYAFAGDYNYRFMPEFEMSLGLRLDNEVYRIEEPELDIPTKRTMLMASATYHLVNFSDTKNNMYLTVAAGIGRSTTTINEESSSGIVTIIPEARIGYLMPLSKKWAMVFESSVESLSSTETFDDGTEQTTNILNIKASIGLRF